MADLTPIVVCLSRSGEATAHRVAAVLGAPVHCRVAPHQAVGEREHVRVSAAS